MKDTTPELVERAVIFAAKAHSGAKRKGNCLPYILHPMEVMALCARITDDLEVIAAAALHDVVEDTDCTIEDIRANFGERVAHLVECESEDKRRDRPAGETWKIRKQEALEREKNAPREAKIIMLCDKLANMRSTLSDWRRDPDHLWEKFNMTDPAEQEWYYRSVAEVLKELSNEPLYREYTDILNQIFGGE